VGPERCNYLVKVGAHEAGHATQKLNQVADLPPSQKGSIMDQMSPQERGAIIREFDAEDAAALAKGFNPP
jgi:flagellar motility protein MotE (MotC chaperone)